MALPGHPNCSSGYFTFLHKQLLYQISLLQNLLFLYSMARGLVMKLKILSTESSQSERAYVRGSEYISS